MATSSSSNGYGSTRTTTVKVRRFIRLKEPRWPFVWWGLLPLLGLIAVTWFALQPFAKGDVETNVRDHTRRALDAAGFAWVNMAVSGQHVKLSGNPPQAGQGDQAVTLAARTLCPTWLGDRVCAVAVVGDFQAATPSPMIAAQPTVMPDYVFAVKDGVLTLMGEMPSAAAKQSVLNAGNALVASGQFRSVVDQMSVLEKPIVPDYRVALDRGLASLRQCLSGQSSLTRGTFALRCNVNAADEAGIRESASAELPVPMQVGQIDLLAVETVAACDQDFAELLSKSKIQFQIGSAMISPSSNGLLDQLATKANTCPGTIRIEGHTDSTGNLEANMVLSRDRAGAVKAALVARSVVENRLVSEGFGPNQPIGDNATVVGRTQNRRIEFKIVTF